ncbi:MAG: SpoIIE family protein phosphatase [Balneolaceae bacterium]|nr:SpoIIE family protein phosphatase [Balneolaceae bacterium]
MSINKEKIYINKWILYACLFLLCVGLTPNVGFSQFGRDVVQLKKTDFTETNELPYLTDTWKYQSGDNESWSLPAYQDSSWQQISTKLGPSEFPFIEWKGIGWFRLNIRVDSALAGYPLAIIPELHNGASEIYLDGKLLYSLGKVSIFEENYIAYQDSRPRPIVFPDTSEHVLAVRYANHEAQVYNSYGFNAGFRFLIGDLDHQISQSLEKATTIPWAQMFYAGGLLAFTIIHFLLFAFYPGEKRNLYFALFAGFLALLTFTLIQKGHTNSPMMAISYYRLSLIALLFTVVYALRFAYSLFYKKTPIQFWGFLAVGAGIAIATWYDADRLGLIRDLFVMVTLLEIIRVLVVSFLRKKEGIWIVGLGLAAFVCGILYTVFTNLDIVSGNPVLGNLYGSVLLILSMSVYLSRDFAKTQKRLEYKLMEVKHLSERSLEQERINKQKELERKLLEVENERKSKELEEARTLQLSMLPKQIPKNDYWDISVFMETAQEVGGDYYDFSISKNGTLTVALGDATGHGMKAGIMVATAKSYFHTLANDHDNMGIIRRMSSGIRNMDLKMMYMGMMLLKCDQHNITYVSAGMPPVLLYQKSSNKAEKLIQKGMPLGSKIEYPYKENCLKMNTGDTLLLMSDGLMELFNDKRELLGLERIKQTFEEVAQSSASDIMSQITKLIDKWAGAKAHEDDITIMVLKAK